MDKKPKVKGSRGPHPYGVRGRGDNKKINRNKAESVEGAVATRLKTGASDYSGWDLRKGSRYVQRNSVQTHGTATAEVLRLGD